MQKFIFMLPVMLFLSSCIQIKDKKQTEEASPQTIEAAPEKAPSFLVKDRIVLSEQFLSGKASKIQKVGVKEYYVMKLSELVMTENSEIITNGTNIKIEADRMYFEKGAKISTFIVGSRAPEGQSGRDGGLIWLASPKAEGSIDLDLHGEDGGHGSAGPAPDATLQGAAGARGENGIYVRNPDMTGAVIRPWDNLRAKYLPEVVCLPLWSGKKPRWGAPGSSGLQGYTGLPGGRGGDSAHLVLQIKDQQNLNLQIIDQNPGTGGFGGLGGEGGQPGLQGPAGEPLPGQPEDKRHYEYFQRMLHCEPEPYQGPLSPGVQGPRGEKGKDGEAGKTLQIEWRS